MSFLAVSLMLASCYGFGAVAMRSIDVWRDLPRLDELVWASVLGLGISGWLVFWLGVAGYFSEFWFLGMIAVGVSFAIILPPVRFFRPSQPQHPSGETKVSCSTVLLWGGLTLVFLFDLAEGLSPPADADTLAYHFSVPKLFVEWEEIKFIPRAVDGGVPLLLHLTYTLAFVVGGELAVTLWVMITGWLCVLSLYCLIKPYTGKNLALAVALILATTPSVVYGAGTGQVEFRNALFVMVSAVALARGVMDGDWRFILVAAVAAGFFAGAKYTGLIYVAASGLTLIIWRPELKLIFIFGIVALISGGQWYVWNWYHTGDPVFPLLFSVLDYPVSDIWSKAHHKAFQQGFFDAEKAVPVNFFEFIAYPFRATLFSPGQFESLRTGFGPYGILVAPFAIFGLWLRRKNAANSQISILALVAILFYTFWFFTASSQRIRHLLPVYPLVLIGLTVATHRMLAKWDAAKPFCLILIFVVSIQLAGHAIFTVKFIKYLISPESRSQFIARNVPLSSPVGWINKNLNQENRIFIDTRYLIYLIKVPYFYGHKFHQAQINILESANDPIAFYDQLNRQGVDHILVSNWLDDPIQRQDSGLLGLSSSVLAANCAEVVHKFKSDRFLSRTLPTLHVAHQSGVVLRLMHDECRLKNPREIN